MVSIRAMSAPSMVPQGLKPKKQRAAVLDSELAEWWRKFKRYRRDLKLGVVEACRRIAEDSGRNWEVVYKVLNRLRPTDDLAKVYLKASSLQMARRVVKEGDPGLLVNVLSRSSIGVLPSDKADVGPQQFVLAVSAESCGAVQIGVTHAPPRRALPSHDDTLGEEDSFGLSEQSGRGGQESEDGSDPHPGGVPAGPAQAEPTIQILDVEPEKPKVRRNQPTTVAGRREIAVKTYQQKRKAKQRAQGRANWKKRQEQTDGQTERRSTEEDAE